MTKTEIESFLSFLDNAPTAWHAVELLSQRLEDEGFQKISETDAWHLKPGGRYFVTRNGSTLCAFIVPTKKPTHAHLVATHTDSPGFKLKPNAEFYKENMVMLGLEVYGGPLIASWLNRDLGIAGRIVYTDSKDKVKESLVRIDDAPVVLPQLAIHLDRQANENGVILNKQDHLSVLAALDHKKKGTYLEQLLKKAVPFKALLGSDLFLFPLEKAAFIGPQQQMIASYRIDNLASVHAGLSAFCASKKPDTEILKLFIAQDNEEIGSDTAQGAGSPFVPHLLERILLSLGMDREEYFRLIKGSLCVSADLTHALHPNYMDKHDPRHQMLMDRGIVIKHNAQHRYASDARSVAAITHLCQKLKLPYQLFACRGDIPCGTTVGPIHAHVMGMSTVDIGISQLSMHSCRELAASQDYLDLCKLLTGFFK
jgi:aspartyl aminopeptidase